MTIPLQHLPGLNDPGPWPSGTSPQVGWYRYLAGPVQVHLLGLPADPEPWLALLTPGASEARRARANRFRIRLDGLRCLAAEALLRHLLAQQYGLASPDLNVGQTPEGKPFLLEHPAIHFNLSHSGPWVMAAVHSAALGVDVETVEAPDPLPAASIMAPDELRQYTGLSADAARQQFFRLWTLKESLLKALGTGLSLDPRGISLAFTGAGPRASHPQQPLGAFTCVELPELPGGARAALSYGPAS